MPTGWRFKPDDEPTPRCPHCGCNDAHVMCRPAADAFLPTGTALCSHCRKVFTFAAQTEEKAVSDDEQGDAEPAEGERSGQAVRYRVVRERLRCPACNSTDFKTDTTRPESAEGSLLRYHVCRSCHKRFSSLER